MADVSLNIPVSATADQIYDLHDALQPALVHGLWSAPGRGAQRHLADERRLPEALVRREGLGYVPPGSDGVRNLIVQLGLSLERAVDAGLLRRSLWQVQRAFERDRKRPATSSAELTSYFLSTCREDRHYYTDYHAINPPSAEGERQQWLHGDWLTIPVRIQTSGGVRIGGYQLRSCRPKAEIGKEGRYRNPVNTPAMVWNHVILRLADEARRIAETGRAAITEGYFDGLGTLAALEAHELATGEPRPGVVALAGINVRGGGTNPGTPEERAGVLTQIGARHNLLFLDQDEPGTQAILTVGPRLSDLGHYVSVARVGDGWSGTPESCPKDPGELFSAAGAEGVMRAVEAGWGRGLVTYAAAELEQRLLNARQGGRAWERLQALDVLLPLVRTSPPATRARASARVAEVVAMPAEAVRSMVAVTPVTATTGVGRGRAAAVPVSGR